MPLWALPGLGADPVELKAFSPSFEPQPTRKFDLTPAVRANPLPEKIQHTAHVDPAQISPGTQRFERAYDEPARQRFVKVPPPGFDDFKASFFNRVERTKPAFELETHEAGDPVRIASVCVAQLGKGFAKLRVHRLRKQRNDLASHLVARVAGVVVRSIFTPHDLMARRIALDVFAADAK